MKSFSNTPQGHISNLDNSAKLAEDKSGSIDFDMPSVSERKTQDLQTPLKFVRNQAAESPTPIEFSIDFDQPESDNSTVVHKTKDLTPAGRGVRPKRKPASKPNNVFGRLKDMFPKLGQSVNTLQENLQKTKTSLKEVESQVKSKAETLVSSIERPQSLSLAMANAAVHSAPVTGGKATSMIFPKVERPKHKPKEVQFNWSWALLGKIAVPVVLLIIVCATYLSSERSTVEVSNRDLLSSLPLSDASNTFDNHPETIEKAKAPVAKNDEKPMSNIATKTVEFKSGGNAIVETASKPIVAATVPVAKAVIVEKKAPVAQPAKKFYTPKVERNLLTKNILKHSALTTTSVVKSKKVDKVKTVVAAKFIIKSVVASTTAPTVDYGEFATSVAKNEIIPIGVLFAKNSFQITSFRSQILEKFVAVFKKLDRGAYIELNGHACKLGTVKYNLQLSKKRANAIKTALVKMGVDTSKIKVQSFGENSFDSSGSQDAQTNLELNRRVNIVVKTAAA